jgi:hypothetical protein
MLALATIFDLARRGLLRIEELPRRFLSKDFALIREAEPPELLPHEKVLWDLLFSTRRGPRDSLRGSELGNILGSRLGGFDRAMTDELVQRGLIDPDRKHRKTIFAIVGLGFILFALAALVAGFGLGGSAGRAGAYQYYPAAAVLVGSGISLFIAAVLAFVLSGAASQLTMKGEAAAARWKGFDEYLKDIAKGKEAAIRPDMFQVYLPLAAGIGLAAGWAKIFEKTGNLELPGWFRPLNSAAHADIAGFVAVISSASSSASSASAGGAGASGGGSSGAG